jgi:hypothetical protein
MINYAILCYIILYYIVLYYIILYYIQYIQVWTIRPLRTEKLIQWFRFSTQKSGAGWGVVLQWAAAEAFAYQSDS